MTHTLAAVLSPLSISIVHMGFSDDTRVTRWGPGKRNTYIIHYVLEGKGFYNNTPVQKGQGFLITPGLLEEYHSDSTDPWHFLWFVAEGEDMGKLFQYYNADPHTLVFNYNFIPQLRALENKIKLMDKNTSNPFELLAFFMEIFKYHLPGQSASQTSSNQEMYLAFAMNYIETHYAQKITVAKLAERLGISQVYLYKIFRQKFGKSPKEYINDYRMTQAKILLKETNLSVSEVGKAVGYDDVLAFSRFFALHESISPSKYRAFIK